MKERPIIFSAPMVRAILEGRKTQTRRVCKGLTSSPETTSADVTYDAVACELRAVNRRVAGVPVVWECIGGVNCPYGQPGDRLWVRETWGHTGSGVWSVGDAALSRDGQLVFRASTEPSVNQWFPSIRITLEVTGVRVERVQEISEDDAIAEGLYVWSDTPRVTGKYYGSNLPDVWETDPRKAYARLWQTINAKRGYSWESNPWVWVIEFRKLEEGMERGRAHA